MRHRTRSLTLASLVVALAASAAVAPALAEPAGAASEKAPAPAAKAATPSAGASQGARTAGTPAQKAYVDPKTGQFVSTPPPGTASQGREALAPADARLPEVPNQTRAGGVRAKVPAYLVQTLTATVQADGSVAMRCTDGPAPTSAPAPAAAPAAKQEAHRER